MSKKIHEYIKQASLCNRRTDVNYMNLKVAENRDELNKTLNLLGITTSAVGYLFSGKRIAYNIGYLNNIDWYEFLKSNWYYIEEKYYKVDKNFSLTTAHEIGHTILQAYGGTDYSYTHEGSSKITQTTISIKDGGKSYDNELSTIGEINLMYYMEDEPWPGNRDYSKYVASEYDVLSLIWLTKIETK